MAVDSRLDYPFNAKSSSCGGGGFVELLTVLAFGAALRRAVRRVHAREDRDGPRSALGEGDRRRDRCGADSAIGSCVSY